jgi:hypothetical protein
MISLWKCALNYRILYIKNLFDAVAGLPPGTVPSTRVLHRLKWWWFNPGYTASVNYLTAICRAADQMRGPILECGSGLTTLLAGAMAAKHGINLHALEHHSEAFRHLKRIVNVLEIGNVHIHHCPLTTYNGFDWYDISGQRLPDGIALVICDGPPGSTSGGRYGLVPMMKASFDPTCRILLDDTHRRKEREIIQHWCHDPSLQIRRTEYRQSFTELLVSA